MCCLKPPRVQWLVHVRLCDTKESQGRILWVGTGEAHDIFPSSGGLRALHPVTLWRGMGKRPPADPRALCLSPARLTRSAAHCGDISPEAEACPRRAGPPASLPSRLSRPRMGSQPVALLLLLLPRGRLSSHCPRQGPPILQSPLNTASCLEPPLAAQRDWGSPGLGPEPSSCTAWPWWLVCSAHGTHSTNSPCARGLTCACGQVGERTRAESEEPSTTLGGELAPAWAASRAGGSGAALEQDGGGHSRPPGGASRPGKQWE